MKRIVMICAAATLLCMSPLLTGCGKTDSSITPADKANFGHVGEPMPQAAKDAMAKMHAGGPSATTAPPAAKH